MSCTPHQQELNEQQLAELVKLITNEAEEDRSRNAKQRLTCPEMLCELIF